MNLQDRSLALNCAYLAACAAKQLRIDTGERREGGMNALISMLTVWLSLNFGLPATTDLPRVDLIPGPKLMEIRSRGLIGRNGLAYQAGQREPMGLYINADKTIYLRDDWTGRSAGDVSVLVHELVHHLQHIGNMRFECPQEREQVAYKAQEKWLSLFGRDLLNEFEIDPFTLLVSSRCIH